MPYPSTSLLPGAALFPGDPSSTTPGVPDIPGWRFVVVDAVSGAAVGEPLATGRSVTFGVSQTATASFSVRSGTPLWTSIAAGDSMLKVYDSTGALRFYGEVILDELNAQGQGGTVRFTCSDLSWRLSKRFTGRDLKGVGDTYTAEDSGQIIFDVLAEANARKPTGIVAGNRGTFVVRTLTLLWKNILELLNELGAISSSYEWSLRYVDGAPPTVYLDLSITLGSSKTTLVFFEYGMGKNNCKNYQRTRSQETSATRVFGLSGASGYVTEGFEPTAETVRRLEDVVTFSDITSPSLVDALVAAHVAFRAQPRRTCVFTPKTIGAPRYGADWVVGDFVTARANVDGLVEVNGTARVWGATINIDELGNETSSPRLDPDA